MEASLLLSIPKETIKLKDLLRGLTHIYDPETDTTSVSWAYRDDEELEYFILEYYDEDLAQWLPYDGHLGVIEKDEW